MSHNYKQEDSSHTVHFCVHSVCGMHLAWKVDMLSPVALAMLKTHVCKPSYHFYFCVVMMLHHMEYGLDVCYVALRILFCLVLLFAFTCEWGGGGVKQKCALPITDKMQR